MRRVWPAPGALACLLTVGLVTAACSGPPPAVRQPVQPKLSSYAAQYTVDEANGVIRIGITNGGHAPVTVTSAGIDWAGFAKAPVKVPAGRLGPGDTVGLTLKPGSARCATPPTGQPGLDVTVDGLQRRIPLTITVPGLLEVFYHRACAARQLAATAAVTLVPTDQQIRRDGYEYLRAVVDLRRTSGTTPVTVDGLNGSVLLDLVALRGSGELPATLAGGDAELRLPVLIGSTNRCDPHARGNSSQTFVLSADVRLAGEPAQLVRLIPDLPTQRRLLALIAANCD